MFRTHEQQCVGRKRTFALIKNLSSFLLRDKPSSREFKDFEQPEGLINERLENPAVRITRIQDDGERFIIHGSEELYTRLSEVFDQIALGISVTRSDKGVANILYTENNRDIVLRMLDEHTE